jgi:hypothetical protein
VASGQSNLYWQLVTGHWPLSALSSRRSFLLRIDPAVLEAVQRWAEDDLRSLNGQIEFLLRRALADAGRARRDAAQSNESEPDEKDGSS